MPEFSVFYSAFATALSWESITVILGGVLLGYIVGVIPGLNRAVAIAIAIPLTFYMSPYAAISFLIGLSKGTAAAVPSPPFFLTPLAKALLQQPAWTATRWHGMGAPEQH